jgi:tetratricopeptide (TPR) repeat protein
MIYVGGTDPGCFIPTFMNETSDGDRHITLTQNALADGTYLDYLNFLYGGQMNTLTQEDSQKAFQDYLADAQKRLEHDQQFPNEPKQVLPGENVSNADGKMQVSGQVAVMAINEKLFQTLMNKNPDASFAMEESFPFKSTFAQAAPLGPVMELRVQDPQNALTADSAAQSVDYWRATADQLSSEPADSDPRKAYSKMISAQAGLLLDQHFPSQAEQDFSIADGICPSSPEVVFRYVNLLADQKRFSDAIPIVERAMQADPSNQQFGGLLDQLKSMK